MSNWDHDAADEAAAKFAEDLATIELTDEQKAILAKVQAMWKDTYMVSGHKRLARALLAADFS